MSVLRDHYYKLGSELPQERLEAAAALIKELSEVNETTEWDYALNRLIKGLHTTRQSARYGFSMALTELSADLIKKNDYDLSVTSFIDRINSNLEIKANMKGKDERAVVFGKLFGLQALINSKIIFDSNYTSADDIHNFVKSLLELAAIKSWLRETAIFTLCSFLRQWSIHESLALFILQTINDSGLNITPEGIAVYLSIPVELRGKVGSKIQNPSKTWNNFDPLSKGNVQYLAKALKDVEADADSSDNKKIQKGSWNPKVHFVWDLIIATLSEATPSEEVFTPSKKRKTHKQKASKVQTSITLKEFWKVVVDETLFSEKSSHERKYWGFDVFMKAFVTVNFHDIEYIITPNLTRCLINQSSQSNRMLNKVSLKVLNFIKQECHKVPIKAPVTLRCLTSPQHGGCWNFDLITKSKTTESLINVLNKSEDLSFDEKKSVILEGIKSVLVDQFNEVPTEPVKTTENIQRWCLNLILQLVRNSKAFLSNDKSYSWIEDILKLLITNAFFKPASGNQVPTSIQSLCKERFNSILADIIISKRGKSSWSLYCINYIERLEESNDFELIQTLDEELVLVKTECVQLLNTVKQMQQKKTKNVDTLYSFELLFSMVLLQIYMGDEDSFSVVSELKACFEGTFTSEEDEDHPKSSVVITEIILSFISKKSALLRRFSSIVWESFLCQKDESGVLRVDEECLELLFNILTAKENKQGQQSLFEEEGEYESGEDGDEEEVDGKEKDQDSAEESESDSDEGKQESDSSDETAKIDQETNIKLAQALGIPTGSSGEVKFEDLSSDDEDSSYESQAADDDEMLAMDDQLSMIFKERRNILESTETGNKRKTDVADAREQMIFFKHRVLDLLEIFVKVQPNSHLNLHMVKPLIILINLTLDKNVGTKAHKILKSKLSKTKIDPEEILDHGQSLFALLEWLHKQFTEVKSSNNAHALACSNSSILIAKNLTLLNLDNLEKIIDIYSASLKTWALKKNNAPPSFFFDYINWLNSRK